MLILQTPAMQPTNQPTIQPTLLLSPRVNIILSMNGLLIAARIIQGVPKGTWKAFPLSILRRNHFDSEFEIMKLNLFYYLLGRDVISF